MLLAQIKTPNSTCSADIKDRPHCLPPLEPGTEKGNMQRIRELHIFWGFALLQAVLQGSDQLSKLSVANNDDSEKPQDKQNEANVGMLLSWSPTEQ